MRSYFKFLTVLFLLCSTGVDAQTNISVHKKEFRLGKSGYTEAWKHVKSGDSFYSEGGIWYAYAFEEYLKAIIYNSSNPELNYKTGVSALHSDKKEEAAGFFLKAIEVKSDVTDDILLFTGRALQYAGRYSEAIEKLNMWFTSPVKKSDNDIVLAKTWLRECSSAIIVTKDTLRIRISNLGSNINSLADDYSEVLSFDGNSLYFASRREMEDSDRRYDDTRFDENIFVSKRISDIWGPASSAGRLLNTKLCEAPVYINLTGDRLYLYVGYENNGDIMVSVNNRGSWKLPESIPYSVNSINTETSFTFNNKGDEIYFVTDGKSDNIGGKDIYFIKKTNEVKWSKPQNAGTVINTPFDEESVRLSRTGDTLFFSSKGHNSIGGFDIFYAVRNREGVWDSVKNYGYPVNTSWDDLFYFPSSNDDSLFYFSSNRSGGAGGMDIYSGRILPPERIIIPPAPPKPDTVIIRDTIVVVKEVVAQPVAKIEVPEPVEELILYLKGRITDSETGEAIITKIDVIDITTDLVIATASSSDQDGSYRVKLPEKKSYMVDLKATGFLSDMKRVDIPMNWPSDFYNLDIQLIKVIVGKKVVLNNILFETGKSILTSGSYVELDHLVTIMRENPLMRIEISGHTDKTGSEPVNFRLSEARAKAVVNYLVQKNIDNLRMEFKGFGSLQPIADNTTPQGRAKNRRVEFKILEF